MRSQFIEPSEIRAILENPDNTKKIVHVVTRYGQDSRTLYPTHRLVRFGPSAGGGLAAFFGTFARHSGRWTIYYALDEIAMVVVGDD